jgi:hypothetical protein
MKPVPLEVTMMRRIGELKAENARLKADFSQMTAWGRGLESDLSRARVELMLAKAEVERLTAFTTRTIIPNEELQAHIERLTKAGDAVCESPYALETDPAVIEWRAAKEGKGQS